MHILVIDDEASIRHLVKLQLELDGQTVETAADGAAAAPLPKHRRRSRRVPAIFPLRPARFPCFVPPWTTTAGGHKHRPHRVDQATVAPLYTEHACLIGVGRYASPKDPSDGQRDPTCPTVPQFTWTMVACAMCTLA